MLLGLVQGIKIIDTNADNTVMMIAISVMEITCFPFFFWKKSGNFSTAKIVSSNPGQIIPKTQHPRVGVGGLAHPSSQSAAPSNAEDKISQLGLINSNSIK